MTEATFVRRLAVVLAAVCGVLVAWQLREVELLFFGAVLFGILFDALARPIGRRLGVGPTSALTVAVAVFATVLLGALAFFGVTIEGQAADLARRLPPAWSRFRSDVGGSPIGSMVVRAVDHMGEQVGDKIAPVVRGYAFTAGQALLGALLIVVAGIYLAARPSFYTDAAVGLAPAGHRRKLRCFLELTGKSLRQWLLAEAVAMLAVGVLTGLALWVIGVPAPGALGVLAAIGEFVPMVGVLIASAPALLLAAAHGWTTVVWTVLLLTAIHQFDGNVLQPLLQRRLNSVPSVVTLFALVGFGAFLGFLGLIFAIPLTLVCLAAFHVWIADRTPESPMLQDVATIDVNAPEQEPAPEKPKIGPRPR